MSGSSWVPVGLCFLLLLAITVWGSSAQAPPRAVEPISPGLRASPLPHESASNLGSQGGGGPARTLLQVDSNVGSHYSTYWKAGDQLAVVLQGHRILYPLRVHSLGCYLFFYEGSMNAVQLQGHVYALSDGAPGAHLGSSAIVDVNLGDPPSRQKWVSLDFSEAGVEIGHPQAFLVAIEYMSGNAGETPSLVIDNSANIPHGICYYQTEPGVWQEHYDFGWENAAGTGYTMVRAWVETPTTTASEPIADAMLFSGQPMLVQGTRSYLLVGNRGAAWGNLRSMLRFPEPSAPLEGATPVAATLSLYHYAAVTQTVPLTITVHRVTDPWDETNAGWFTHSNSYAEAYGSTTIPARDAPLPWVDQLLHMDVTDLVTSWLESVFPDYGMMLTGGEDVPESCKWMRSREWDTKEQRPRLLIKWAQPTPTPTITPTPTATPVMEYLSLPFIRKG